MKDKNVWETPYTLRNGRSVEIRSLKDHLISTALEFTGCARFIFGIAAFFTFIYYFKFQSAVFTGVYLSFFHIMAVRQINHRYRMGVSINKSFAHYLLDESPTLTRNFNSSSFDYTDDARTLDRKIQA